MAIVADSSGNSPIGGAVDNALGSINRTGAADPNGSVTPLFSGEIYHDTTNNVTYKSFGTVNTDWARFDYAP